MLNSGRENKIKNRRSNRYVFAFVISRKEDRSIKNPAWFVTSKYSFNHTINLFLFREMQNNHTRPTYIFSTAKQNCTVIFYIARGGAVCGGGGSTVGGWRSKRVFRTGVCLWQLVVKVKDVRLETQLHLLLGLVFLLGCLPTRCFHMDGTLIIMA